MYQTFIGIDIAKDSFVSAMHGNQTTHTYENTPQGFSQFSLDYAEHLSKALVMTLCFVIPVYSACCHSGVLNRNLLNLVDDIRI